MWQLDSTATLASDYHWNRFQGLGAISYASLVGSSLPLGNSHELHGSTEQETRETESHVVILLGLPMKLRQSERWR